MREVRLDRAAEGTTETATLVRRTAVRTDDRLMLCEPVEADALYVTVKLDAPPESVRAEVVASTAEPATMSIEASCQVELSIAPVLPLIVAVALVNVTDPKLANGKMPDEDEGASTTHSADDLAGEEAGW